LPSQRALAKALRIDLTTVSRALLEANRRGLIDTASGRGTFIRKPSSRSAPRPDPAPSIMPPMPSDAELRSLFREGMENVLQRTDLGEILRHRTGGNTAADHRIAAQWLSPRLEVADLGRVVVAPGVQSVLAAVLTMFAGRGDVILTERLADPGVRAVALHFGMRLVGLETDEDGILPDALEAASVQLNPKILCCAPTLHYPTTATTSLERRRALAAVIIKHGLMVLENDTYASLANDAPPPLAALAPEQTIYLRGFSKIIIPALRVAYVVTPSAPCALRLMEALRAISLTASPMATTLTGQWIADGTAQKLLNAVRRETMARHRLARTLLPHGTFRGAPGADFLWLALPAPLFTSEFLAFVRQLGLAIASARDFTVSGAPPDAVCLGLGTARDQDTLRNALTAVAAAMARPQ
jgi:DNA-binding transcriptional MocR family regulator